MPEQSSINTRTVILVAVGLLLGFVVGFALANRINGQENDKLRSELARLKAGGPQQKDAGGQSAGGQGASQRPAGDGNSLPTLTDDQLKSAVAKADASPADAAVQKQAGKALYYYALEKGNAAILPDVARILGRAHDLDTKDYQTAVLAANAHFILARNGDDSARYADARKLYEAALASKPDDAVVRTSLGLTYFYGEPSDARRAIREYRQALKSDPRQEMALQSLAAALIETGDFTEAESRLGELEKVNSSNPELAGLRAQLEQKKNAAKDSK
jgi:predicted Zn-dependent protease